MFSICISRIFKKKPTPKYEIIFNRKFTKLNPTGLKSQTNLEALVESLELFIQNSSEEDYFDSSEVFLLKKSGFPKEKISQFNLRKYAAPFPGTEIQIYFVKEELFQEFLVNLDQAPRSLGVYFLDNENLTVCFALENEQLFDSD